MTFRRNNHSPHRIGPLLVSALPEEVLGKVGPIFQSQVFSPEIGSEVCLVLLEAEDVPSLATPAVLKATVGSATTKFGPVLWLLWSVSEEGQLRAAYEQFVNPLEQNNEQLIHDAATQAFFKVIMVNSLNGSVIDMVEFENCFIGLEHVELIRKLREEFDGNRQGTIDFQKAVKEFSERNSLEDLIKYSS